MNEKELRAQADDLYGKRRALQTLWQEIAEHFYPQRADFTYQRYLGDEFADHLTTSYPLLTRREFADQIGTMLRPKGQEWFHQTVEDPDSLSIKGQRWLQHSTRIQRNVMYHRKTKFSRALKEADGDFATFGQAVIQTRPNVEFTLPIYRTWHLRDCCWQENEYGDVGFFARRWKPRAHVLVSLFKDGAGQKAKDIAGKSPMMEIDCLHMIVPAEMWDGEARGQPFVSIYYDTMHDHVIEAEPVPMHEYVVPRWQTVSGSQYAYSPATVCALPDARLIQSMSYTLLEAGEKIVNPPMLATTEVIKSDVAMFAGGITWLDRDYDERLGDALRPMTRETRGLPWSREMLTDQRMMLRAAFFLDKLELPERGPEMTAYEVGQRVQAYIRGALPLFEPMEDEYNGGICERSFDLLLRMGFFGSPLDIPDEIRERGEITYRYESPLHSAIDAVRGNTFAEARALIDEAMAIDETASAVLDAPVALRDALDGIGVPAEWMRDPVDEADIREALEARRTAAELLPAAKDGAQALAAMPAAETMQ